MIHLLHFVHHCFNNSVWLITGSLSFIKTGMMWLSVISSKVASTVLASIKAFVLETVSFAALSDCPFMDECCEEEIDVASSTGPSCVRGLLHFIQFDKL